MSSAARRQSARFLFRNDSCTDALIHRRRTVYAPRSTEVPTGLSGCYRALFAGGGALDAAKCMAPVQPNSFLGCQPPMWHKAVDCVARLETLG
jgi:hypothetical protein